MTAHLLRTVRQLACLVALAMLLSVAGAAAQDRASTLRVQLGGNLVVFDPIFTANGTVRRAAWLVHDFLFALDGNNVPKPQMLETYSMSADGMTIEERPAPDADVRITGPERAWVEAFSPTASRDGLTIEGDERLADSVIEMCGAPASSGASSAVA